MFTNPLYYRRIGFNPDCKCCDDIKAGAFPFVTEYGGRYSEGYRRDFELVKVIA